MPRVVAGSAGGIRLLAPDGRDTRPTSDRVKEALFSILAARLEGADVLDLYAGTGQLGIEALSRGARSAAFVERDRACAALLRGNLERTRLADGAEVLAMSADAALVRLAQDGRSFDLVLLDPPYAVAHDALRDAASAFAAHSLLRPGAAVVLEHDARHEPEPLVINLQRLRSCRYGGTMLTFYSERSDRPAPGGTT